MLTQFRHAYARLGFMGVLLYWNPLVPKGFVLKCRFFRHYHRWVNENNPQFFSEKLITVYDKVYSDDALVTRCADKYLVRDYVKKIAGGGILNEILGVYNSASDIPWDKLPGKFVLKCNHGSGYNIFVRDKEAADRQAIEKQMDYWLEENYGVITGEWQYKRIQPRIIVEKFLETDNDSLPVDYKFMCSRGKVLYCMLILGRECRPVKLCVDENFDDMHLISNSDIPENYRAYYPKSYKEMWRIAGELSKDFPIVRVDLYNIKDTPIFGELTFTPAGCINSYFDKETQIELGEKVML